MNNSFLLFGSNLIQPQDNINQAIELLKNQDIEIVKLSSFYKSEPWGFKSKNWFYNRLAEVNGNENAILLHSKIAAIENEMGRISKSEGEYNDRIIDIDILFFNNEIINMPELQIPHPRLHLRKFALITLLEICPNYIHPVLKQTVQNMWCECTDKGEVIKT
jgi:2-amino-4-hydroxy-6-hydroxymethyldihydropteridine diphosphokinase